jgi:hypothetical protein
MARLRALLSPLLLLFCTTLSIAEPSIELTPFPGVARLSIETAKGLLAGDSSRKWRLIGTAVRLATLNKCKEPANYVFYLNGSVTITRCDIQGRSITTSHKWTVALENQIDVVVKIDKSDYALVVKPNSNFKNILLRTRSKSVIIPVIDEELLLMEQE